MNIPENYLLRALNHAKELPQTCKRIEEALRNDDFTDAGFELAKILTSSQTVDGIYKDFDRENISMPVYSVGDSAA